MKESSATEIIFPQSGGCCRSPGLKKVFDHLRERRRREREIPVVHLLGRDRRWRGERVALARSSRSSTCRVSRANIHQDPITALCTQESYCSIFKSPYGCVIIFLDLSAHWLALVEGCKINESNEQPYAHTQERFF
jgi:hypothetical protein